MMSVDLGRQFEEILVDIKGNGRYQFIIIYLVLLPTFFSCSFIGSAWLFVVASPDTYSCHISLFGENDSLTVDEKKVLLPPGKDGELFSKCELYAVNYSTLLQEMESIQAVQNYLNASNSSLSRKICTFWDFDKTLYEATIVTEWNLVCEGRDFFPTLAYILSSLGVMVGTPLGGFAADRFGRKRTYFGFLFFQLIFGTATVFSPQAAYGYYIFVTLYVIHSISINPTYLVPSTLGMEIILPNFRASFLVLLTIAYTCGSMAFTGVAYALRSWRPMVLATILPFFLYGFFWFFMPESPRWLISKKRFDDVECFLRHVAKKNKVEWNNSLQEKFEKLKNENFQNENFENSSKISSYSYFDLFRGPVIRRKTLLMMTLSIVAQVCYYGLGYYAVLETANPYLSFFLSSLVEIPGALLIQAVCDRLGRRLTILLCFIVGGTCCLSTLALPPKTSPFFAVLILFLIAKLFVTSAYSVQELLVNELLPTVVRGKGVALTNFVSSFFSNIGPIIVYSGQADSESLSLVIFGGLMIFASVCALFLPETLNSPLLETLEECEKMGKNSSWKEAFTFCQSTTAGHSAFQPCRTLTVNAVSSTDLLNSTEIPPSESEETHM